MPIGDILIQPAANAVAAAYRPVVIRTVATKTGGDPIPPVVYCDIYFNDVFYKTISKTQYSKLNELNSEWEFDIQDAAQEYLQKFLGVNGEQAIIEATPVITKVQCKLRSSGFDGDGFITAEDVTPVQGTGDTDPVAGTGTATNTFYIVNSTLQHRDNQTLASHLYYYKNRTWNANSLPLSHRPDGYKIGPADSDVFPIIYSGAAEFKKLRLKYKLCGQTEFSSLDYNLGSGPACSAIISDLVAEQNITGWLISWDLLFGAPAKYIVSTPAVMGGAPQETVTTSFQYLFADLPVGTHLITVRPLCLIEGEYYPGAAKTIEVVVGACVAGGYAEEPTLPDAVAGVAYSHSINLQGSAPFALIDINKPDWLDISVVGSTIEFSGMPDAGDVGEDIIVSFNITNCGGENLFAFDMTFDVTEPVGCVDSGGVFNPPNAEVGEFYNYTMALTGTPPFSINSAAIPDWMNASIVGSNLNLTGTPAPGDEDGHVELDIAILNCLDSVVHFTDSISVLL